MDKILSSQNHYKAPSGPPMEEKIKLLGNMHGGIRSCIHKLYQLNGNIETVDVVDKAVI